jgi:hypothetical protein
VEFALIHDNCVGFSGRCIGPTGTIDLTETPVAHKQKDRLAAVSPKSDQVF